MTLGEHATLRISAACGYGAQGSPPVIPPNSDLVFDVVLAAINGRRASAAPPHVMLPPPLPSFSLSVGAPVGSMSLGASASVGRTPPPALPECIASACGHAISFDTTGASRPLCLCNPLCQSWASTPGILPCCPKLQEICLDPLRSPSPHPPPAPVSMAAAPVSMAASVAATPATLPTCRPGSCGKAMAAGINSMTAICACDASCLAPGSSLPCCQSFREVCQSAPVAINVAVSAPVLQQQPPAPQVTATAGMQAQPSATGGMQAQPSATGGMQAQPSATVQASAPQQSHPAAKNGCAIGKTNWAEQPACDQKRYAMKGGGCKKVCPAIDPQASVKFFPKGQNGKKACVAALALCN